MRSCEKMMACLCLGVFVVATSGITPLMASERTREGDVLANEYNIAGRAKALADQNCYVGMLQIVSPEMWSQAVHDKSVEALQVSNAVARGDVERLQPFDSVPASHMNDELRRLISTDSWTPDQVKRVKDWRDGNRHALRHLRVVSGRPIFFAPLVTNNHSEHLELVVVVVRALLVDSRAYLLEGKSEEAWATWCAAKTIARRLAQDPFVLSNITSSVIEGRLHQHLAAVSSKGGLSRSDAEQLQSALFAMSPRASVRAGLLEGDRIMLMKEMYSYAENQQGDAADGIQNTLREALSEEKAKVVVKTGKIVPNIVSDRIQRGLSTYIYSLRSGTAEQQRQRIESLEDRYVLTNDRIKRVAESVIQDRDKDGRRFSQFFGDWLIGKRIAPLGDDLVIVEWKSEAIKAVELTALAMIRYAHRHGQWPDRLADLVPEFMTSVPIDPFNGSSLGYRLNDRSTVAIYSVGMDGRDDQGDSDDDVVMEVRLPKGKGGQTPN